MKNLPPCLSKQFNAFQQATQSVLGALLTLCFPWPCPVCGSSQKYDEVLCGPCATNLPVIPEPLCRRCGSPMPDHWRVKVCPECRARKSPIALTRSRFLYEQPVLQMIRQVKFSRKARYLKYFAEQLFVLSSSQFPRTVEAIVPVPLHRKREWERTFNQSDLLARYHSSLSGLPVVNLLERTVSTQPQTSLSGAARRRNLHNAFVCRKETRMPRSVILIDDVVTTGATLEACAALLRKNGVRKVYALTIARAVLKHAPI